MECSKTQNILVWKRSKLFSRKTVEAHFMKKKKETEAKLVFLRFQESKTENKFYAISFGSRMGLMP